MIENEAALRVVEASQGELFRGESSEFARTPGDAAKPFLRWAGGKSRLLQAILPFVPGTFKSFHEPFLGSGAVFFAVRKRAKGSIHLSDLNEELINAWSAIQARPLAFWRSLDAYADCNSEADYYRVREEQPSDSIRAAARFFYLNQTAWNGLWRVNRWGRFNVPWGDRPFRGITLAQVRAVGAALNGAKVAVRDFRESLSEARRGDFVYLDPPYLPVSDTSKFHGYTQTRFRKPDLAALAKACDELTERGVSWIMSNRDTQTVRDLFSNHQVVRFTTRRSVAAQNRRDIEPRDSPEIIVLGLGAR